MECTQVHEVVEVPAELEEDEDEDEAKVEVEVEVEEEGALRALRFRGVEQEHAVRFQDQEAKTLHKKELGAITDLWKAKPPT